MMLTEQPSRFDVTLKFFRQWFPAFAKTKRMLITKWKCFRWKGNSIDECCFRLPAVWQGLPRDLVNVSKYVIVIYNIFKPTDTWHFLNTHNLLSGGAHLIVSWFNRERQKSHSFCIPTSSKLFSLPLVHHRVWREKQMRIIFSNGKKPLAE